jgi:4-diphosphocytidyl-2-C-methyl-D-erythritol kinase
MIVKTNVKINLGLNVLRRRSDGYHDIETLFVPYSGYGDTIEIITGDDYSHTSAKLFAKYAPLDSPLHLDDTAMIAQGISEDGKLMMTIAREEGVDWDPLNDLCAKAYNLLAEDFKLPPVKIFLEKTAPVGAGLGGGSADAAFTLKALNELFGLGLKDDEPSAEGKPSLKEYAARLGSDCAFFIFNRPMVGTGRGDMLKPLTAIAGIPMGSEDIFEKLGLELKVIVPEGISVSTAEAYKGIQPRESSGSAESEGFERRKDRLEQSRAAGLADDEVTEPLTDAQQKPVAEWKDNIFNDFEATVFKANPELAAIKQSLYDAGAVYASMSGSGSALFALYRK